MSDQLSRRDFFVRATQGACAVVLGSLAFDITHLPRIYARTRPDDPTMITISLPEYPALEKTGGAVVIEANDGDIQILVARFAEIKFTAVGLICTHLGCELKYDNDVKHFLCPCHGSEFDIDGSLLQGPAKKSVACYPITFDEEKQELSLSLTPIATGVLPDSVKADTTSPVNKKPE